MDNKKKRGVFIRDLIKFMAVSGIFGKRDLDLELLPPPPPFPELEQESEFKEKVIPKIKETSAKGLEYKGKGTKKRIEIKSKLKPPEKTKKSKIERKEDLSEIYQKLGLDKIEEKKKSAEWRKWLQDNLKEKNMLEEQEIEVSPKKTDVFDELEAKKLQILKKREELESKDKEKISIKEAKKSILPKDKKSLREKTFGFLSRVKISKKPQEEHIESQEIEPIKQEETMLEEEIEAIEEPIEKTVDKPIIKKSLIKTKKEKKSAKKDKELKAEIVDATKQLKSGPKLEFQEIPVKDDSKIQQDTDEDLAEELDELDGYPKIKKDRKQIEPKFLEIETEKLPEIAKIEEEIKKAIQSAKKTDKSFIPTKIFEDKKEPEEKVEMPHVMPRFEEKVDKVMLVEDNIHKARVALMDFRFDAAKKIYVEIMEMYNSLEPKQKSKVYQDISDLYYERKSAEKYAKV